MSEVINLNQKRKVKARAQHEKKASQNRVKFGRTKVEKKIEKLKVKKAEQKLEGHRLETDDTSDK